MKKIDSAKEQIQKVSNSSGPGFIKTTDAPINISIEQKAQLNRKGNALFNDGNIEGAKKIFMATGYSDGLTRVGDAYKKQGKPLEALKQYYLAHNKSETEAMYEKLAQIISQMIKN